MSHLDLEPLNPGTHLRSSKIYYYKPTSNNKSGFAQQMDLMKKWSDNITGVIMLSPPVADYIDCLDFIKEKGGFTLALDSLEKSSEHTFDYLVSYKEAGAKITEIIKLKEDLCQKTVIDFQSRDFITLLKMLFNYSGCDFSGYKDLTLKRRITRRMILKKIFDFKKYIDYLSNNKDELQALYTELFISVTSFFRDPDAFNVLAQNLETKLLDFDAERIFRVWVPACAHGHEAFSIAMIISWILKKINRQINYIIFATDINDASIDFARKAQYPKGAIEHINQYNPDFTENFFTINEGFYQIIKSIREKTIFAKQDIIGDPSFSRVDLISCRNLLIYFKNDLQDKLLSMFHYSLNSEGLLFLGKSESTGRLDYFFAPINKEQKLFKQRNVIRSKPGSFRKKSSFIEHDLKKTHHTKDSAPLVISDIVNSALASFFGPPSILVSKNMELLYIHRDADRFFKIKPGEAGLNILDLAVPQIRAGLSSAIYRARREKSRVTIKNISLNSESGALDIDITANPLKEMENTSEFMLISFDSNSEKTIKPQFSGDARGFKEQYIVELEQELEASRNNLQITIEDIEAANEELQSLNEELQSTNEEFETSNEELQAVNEELCTVNEELNAKSLELTEANLYLENILKKMEIPLILIDNNLNIIKFTPPIKKIFKICDQHLGDPLLNYIDNDQIPGFSELLNSVFSKNVNLGMIINYNKRVYTMKASIYEGAKYSKGAILTFVDITSEHERAQEFKALAENSPDTVIRLSKNFTCLFANKNIKNLTNLLPADIIGKSIDDFNFPGPALEIWKNALNSSLKKRGDNSFIFEITQKSKKSIYECRIAKEHTFSNKVASLLVVVRDITLRHDTQMLLKKLFENIPVMILIFDSDFNIQSVNRCFEETTGWSSQEALSMDLLQECYPDEDYQNKALNSLI
jgi:two-component system CheB/CheR fusion protein